MVNFSSWLNGENSPADEYKYAGRAWTRIQYNPTSIILTRGSITLAAQTVSIHDGNEEQHIEGTGGAQGSKRETIIFGVKGHPDDAVADTDIKRGDKFSRNGRLYVVTDVTEKFGSVQAWTEAVS
jgi:hypothetical protein